MLHVLAVRRFVEVKRETPHDYGLHMDSHPVTWSLYEGRYISMPSGSLSLSSDRIVFFVGLRLANLALTGLSRTNEPST